MVTEFGPQGFWERPKTAWEAPLEQTSTEKAEALRRGYRKTIRPDGGCLGAYVFLWGQKQEATATWFGLFTRQGERVAAVNVMQELWGGPPVSNRAPSVSGLTAEVSASGAAAGAAIRVKMSASDPDGDPLSYRWEVLPETPRRDDKGKEIPMDPLVGATANSHGAETTIIAPAKPGNYRVYGFALDGKGNAGTANVPFQVK
jgi:hypothetical protein